MNRQVDPVILSFAKEYNIKHMNQFQDGKIKHRFACYKGLKQIRQQEIPEFGMDKSKETILIDFRPLPHMEYLLRNTILKLPNWNYTVVCGNLNYDFISSMCDDICKNIKSKIKIIRLDMDNINLTEYSQLLMSYDFWLNFEAFLVFYFLQIFHWV